ncbi:MAG: radical SAM protein [Clostridia bacterium]|nr:radical SAM protein [Clostridia bacterium]
MKKHANVPVFVPHIGCPNDCVFCNQHTISGKGKFDPNSVDKEIDLALETLTGFEGEVQIAFFGGSFTGIERGLMLMLLEKAKAYIDKGKVSSVRLSTRPDYIDEEILDILSGYSVTDIELGIQSMNDRVLSLNKRGHTADTSRRAMALIKERGFNLTGQMMTGMYGATPEDEVFCAEEIVKCGADSARIYPTVTFRDTALEKLFLKGEYTPPTLDDTIERGARVYKIFENAGVRVIRIGLQSTEGLHSDNVIAGDYKDALGEMILSRVRLHEMKDYFAKNDTDTIYVPSNLISQYVGQKRGNVVLLEKELNKKIKIKGK